MDNHPNANRQIINCHGERTYRSSSRHACENNSDACEDNTTNCTAGGNDRYFSLSHDTTSSPPYRRHYSITRANSSAAIDEYTKSCSSSDDGAAIGQKRRISDDATHEEARQHSLLPPPHTGINNKKLKLCREGILLIWGRLLALPTVEQFMDELKQYSFSNVIAKIGYELDCYEGFIGGYGQEEGESPEDDLRRTLKQLYLDHRYQELAKSITLDNEREVLLPHLLQRLCSNQSNPDLSLISSIVQSCSRFNTPKDNAGVAKVGRRSKGEENGQSPTQSASIGKCLVCVMLLCTIISSHYMPSAI